jgi:RND family efflux transporter MFP subunit
MSKQVRALVPVVAMILLCGGVPIVRAQEGPPPAPVQVGYALEQSMAPHTWIPGTVMSRSTAAIASEVSGQLIWVADVGERVEAGEAVARINDQSLQLQLKNDEATIKRLEAQLKYLDQQVERTRRLTEQQVAPANDLEEVESQREATRQELVQAEVGRERTEYELDRTRVKAPFSGEVVRRLQQPGSYSGVGEEIVWLVDTGNVEARVQAPLTVAPYLIEGMKVAVRSGDLETDGAIRQIVPVGDERSRMFELRISLSDQAWIVGSPVRVAVPNADSRRVIAVPRDALILRQGGIHLFKVLEDGTAEKIPVETGVGHESLIEVRGRVTAGDKVVVRGGERLQPGQAVVISSGSKSSSAG